MCPARSPWCCACGCSDPLEVRVDGDWTSPSGRGAALLALLAAEPGATVPVDRLVDALWPGAAPKDPANAIQILVSRLRARLGPDLVETQPGGYRLALPAAELDAVAFERLVRASAQGAPAEAAELLGSRRAAVARAGLLAVRRPARRP